MDAVRLGALAAERLDIDGAEEAFGTAFRLLPASAAPPFHLALLLAETRRLDEARELYNQAVRLDATYRTAIDSAGLLYQSALRLSRIERSLTRNLALDETDQYALLGLARLAIERRQWGRASSCSGA
jgi:tetratricopeptide (TPR) repeat protein